VYAEISLEFRVLPRSWCIIMKNKPINIRWLIKIDRRFLYLTKMCIISQCLTLR
jgi:hypothetical protein